MQLNQEVPAHRPRDFRQSLFAMLGLCFVLIMVALDQTVIGTALPTVVAELHGFDMYAWAGTAYLLASVVTVPVFGKLGDEHGRKPFVLAAIILFTLASMLCGMAHSMLQLVLARALQGIAGGMLIATCFASVPDLFPEPRERLRWQILFSSAFGLANAVGPSLGGYLTEYWGWRWVFFVNLPVGLVSLAFVWGYLPRIRHTDQPPSRMDWLGALLVALTLGCLQLVVEWLPQHKPALLLGGVAVTAAIAGALLVWWERRCENPVVPLAMFGHHVLGSMFALSVIMGFSMFSVMYYAPLLFQGGFGLSPSQAGLLVTPLAVSITVGSIINGRIVTRIPAPNVMLYAGVTCFASAVLFLTQTSVGMAHSSIAGAMMLGGLGLGFLLPNMTLVAQASSARTQLGVATALLQSMRMVGSMLGTAVVGSLIGHWYTTGVDSMLGANQAGAWSAWLGDPQILVDHARAQQFVAQPDLAGHQAAQFLAHAREALVGAIHRSEWLVAGLMALAFWLVHRQPSLSIHRHNETAPHE